MNHNSAKQNRTEQDYSCTILWEYLNTYPAEYHVMTVTQLDVIWLMTLDEISLISINDKVAEGVEQDQTTRMCGFILLYTLRTVNPYS